MPYIKVKFDYVNSNYYISNKTDGTNLQLSDDHPVTKYFNEIHPPHFSFRGLENYTGIIYSVTRDKSPFKMPFSPAVDYFVKI